MPAESTSGTAACVLAVAAGAVISEQPNDEALATIKEGQCFAMAPSAKGYAGMASLSAVLEEDP